MLLAFFTLVAIYAAIIESFQPALASTLMPEDQHGAGFARMSAVDGLGDFLSSITMGMLWTAVSPQMPVSWTPEFSPWDRRYCWPGCASRRSAHAECLSPRKAR
jgi:hypothetical protein